MNSTIYKDKNNIAFEKKFLRFTTVLAGILFGVSFMLTPALKKGAVDVLPSIFNFAIGFSLFEITITFLIYSINWYHQESKDTSLMWSNKKLFFLCFILTFCIGVVYLIIYYPGVGMYDSIAIVQDRTLSMAKQHPWFYCLLIQILVKLVFFLGGDYETVFIFQSLIQIIMIAIITSYSIVWLNQKGLKRKPLFIIMAIYTFLPIFNFYMISLFKDVPFSYLLLIWCILLYDLWESKGENLKKASVIIQMSMCLVFSLLRNNGIYVSAFILFCMLISFRKYWKRIACLIIVLIFIVLGSHAFEKTNSITHLFKETIGIPLQQIAATVYYDGKISDKQMEFINQVLDIKFIQENYDPYTVDTLKWGGAPINDRFLSENKVDFFRIWAEMLFPNFKIYVKAYLQNTYGFWAFASNNTKPYSTIYVQGLSDWINENDISIKSILPESVQQFMEEITYNGSISPGEGQLFWYTLILVLALCRVKRKGVWIIAAPGMGGWLTVMISTPVAFQWRYVLYLALMIPLFIGLLMITSSKQNSYEE